MLVKREIVQAWYVKTHPIYKAFAFLFQNPFWKKEVPRGFTVCPFFWMAMFSFFIFRPVLVLLVIPFTKLVKILGTPGAKFDRFIRRVFKLSDSLAPGLPTLLFVASCAAITFGGLILWEIAQWYLTSIAPNRELTLIFWSAASYPAVLSAVALYKRKHAYPDRCHVEVYTYIWAVVIIGVCLVFANNELVSALKWFWSGIAFVLSAIWGGLSSGFTTAISWIVVAIKWCAVFVWNFLSYCPKGMVPYTPWWAYLVVVFGGLGWIMSKFDMLDVYEALGNIQHQPAEPGPQGDLKEDHLGSWRLFLTGVIANHPATLNHMNDCIPRQLEESSGSEDECTPSGARSPKKAALKEMQRSLLEKFAAIYVDKFIADFAGLAFKHGIRLAYKNNPQNLSETLGDIRVKAISILDLTGDATNKLDNIQNMNWYLFATIARAGFADKEFRSDFFNRVQLIKADYVRLADKKRNSRMTKWCKKFTGAAHTRIEAVLGFSGMGLRRGWNLIRSVCKNVWVFLAFVFSLIKAKKQGACPYFQFEDVKPPAPVTAEQK